MSFARKITLSPFPWQEVTAAPAVCNGILQGILTFADGCVLRADVGIYTRIINYIPWIENTIRNNWVLMAGILDPVTPPVPKSSLRIKSNQVSWVASHTSVLRLPHRVGGWCLPVCDYTWQLFLLPYWRWWQTPYLLEFMKWRLCSR